MNAIVTGATGFIGSWLVEELLKHDYDVTVVVRNKNSLLPEFHSHSNLHCIEKSLEALQADDFDSARHYDTFYHLAWNGVALAQKNDAEAQVKNISLSLCALDICSNLRCGRFISAGSVAEHVFCRGVMDVCAKATPNDLYGAAKVSVHHFLEVRARQLSIPFNWIIIPSTFGERRTDDNIITYTIRSLKRGETPIYGTLEQLWDFLYVADVVDAIRLIGERGLPGKEYGIGSGEYRPLKAYMETIRNLIDPNLPLGIGQLPAMSKQTFSSCVNIDDLIHDTGFAPKTSFEEGIKKMIQWFDAVQ